MASCHSSSRDCCCALYGQSLSAHTIHKSDVVLLALWRAGDSSAQAWHTPPSAACLEGGTCTTSHEYAYSVASATQALICLLRAALEEQQGWWLRGAGWHEPFQTRAPQFLLLQLLYWGKGHANPFAAHSQRANPCSCDFLPLRSPVSQVRCIGEGNSPTSQSSIPVAFQFMGVPSTHQWLHWTR
jgi:hypothetical protein